VVVVRAVVVVVVGDVDVVVVRAVVVVVVGDVDVVGVVDGSPLQADEKINIVRKNQAQHVGHLSGGWAWTSSSHSSS
jgi:hypothetical protein